MTKRHMVWLLAAPLLLAACGDPEATKVVITASGDATGYKDIPFCVDVTWNSPTTSYTTGHCSSVNVEGKFNVSITGHALDAAADFFDHTGDVYLSFPGATNIPGTVLTREEEYEDEVAVVKITASFELPMAPD